MQEVDAVCDRVLVLRNGRLALDRRLSELRESRSLLLRTDAMTEQLAADLRDVPQVAALDQSAPADGPARCQILLHDAVDMDLAASAIASVVMQSGGRLYQLAPVSRDLDTVFREATADGA
jgi:ABC-2 type transport system ATP-binding protein